MANEGVPGSLEAAFQQTCDILARSASKVEQLLVDWDADGNGLIDKKEFRNACRAMGVLFDRAILDKLFELFDDDDSGNLDHRELVMKARKAAFQRGFIPKREAPEPTAARRFDMYWEKRNQRNVDKHRTMVMHREALDDARRKAAIDDRRAELLRQMKEKNETTRQMGVGRRERFWMRRAREDNAAAQELAAAAPVRTRIRKASAEDEVVFLPSLPESRALAKKTWARDRVRERTSETLEAMNDVNKLQDVWVGSIIDLWKQPSQEEVRAALHCPYICSGVPPLLSALCSAILCSALLASLLLVLTRVPSDLPPHGRADPRSAASQASQRREGPSTQQ